MAASTPTQMLANDSRSPSAGRPSVRRDAAYLVNAVFLQEIKDSNPDLWQLVKQLEPVCRYDDADAAAIRRITRVLDDLRDAIALQFALEETYGYVTLPPATVDAASLPNDSMRVMPLTATARAQHATLYLTLSELAERAEEIQYRGVRCEDLVDLVTRVRRFDREFRGHETLEARLIRLGSPQPIGETR